MTLSDDAVLACIFANDFLLFSLPLLAPGSGWSCKIKEVS